jgi:hypothetical protein
MSSSPKRLVDRRRISIQATRLVAALVPVVGFSFARSGTPSAELRLPTYVTYAALKPALATVPDLVRWEHLVFDG